MFELELATSGSESPRHFKPCRPPSLPFLSFPLPLAQLRSPVVIAVVLPPQPNSSCMQLRRVLALLPGLLASSIAAGIAPATVAAAVARHGRRVLHRGQLPLSFLCPSRPHPCLPQFVLNLRRPSSGRCRHRSIACSSHRRQDDRWSACVRGQRSMGHLRSSCGHQWVRPGMEMPLHISLAADEHRPAEFEPRRASSVLQNATRGFAPE
jgi:hypothetical protein